MIHDTPNALLTDANPTFAGLSDATKKAIADALPPNPAAHIAQAGRNAFMTPRTVQPATNVQDSGAHSNTPPDSVQAHIAEQSRLAFAGALPCSDR